MAKCTDDILYCYESKTDLITYRNPHKGRHMIPYRLDSVKVNGTTVTIELMDGTIRYLPPCKKGFKFKSNDKFQIVLVREV